MRSVQIVGVAPTVALTPAVVDERWCFNVPRVYRVRGLKDAGSWTRWFNLHSARHQQRTYPQVVQWYTQQGKPVILQGEFPAAAIIEGFGTRYFTCSAAWLIALALMEGFERIELWGIGGDHDYAQQQPCLAYWVQRARDAGVEVTTVVDFGEPGNSTYHGPLYGLETT